MKTFIAFLQIVYRRGRRRLMGCAFCLLMVVGLLLSSSGCSDDAKPSKHNPVKLTIWHTYVEGMRDSFDKLVDEFNATIGEENGITVKVTAIANAPVINEQLLAAANRDPGAPEMPDMAVVYPKVAVTLATQGALVDLDEQFSEKELDEFVPQFVEEGRLESDALYLLPIAKSTEVLYLNRTLFERFSEATGVGEASLATFEGLAEASMRYYDWTDAQTPEVPNDGKAFYYPDGLFNAAMIGYRQLDGDIVDGNRLALAAPQFEQIWNSYFTPAVKGGVAIYNDYGNYLAATGDIVCCSSTSAGASFYPTSVTYADNTKEDVVFDILPYPVFEGGQKVAFQRGGGVCVAKSTPTKERAAAMFLKWFTAPDCNLHFTAETGYMPVQTAAFKDVLDGKLPPIETPIVKKALVATANMSKDYQFYFPPVFDGFDELQTGFVEQIQQWVRTKRDEYLSQLESTNPQTAYENVSEDALSEFIDQYQP